MTSSTGIRRLALWSTLSWIVTIALISLGWILLPCRFPVAKAAQMFTAVLSPRRYATHFVSGSLYLLVLLLELGMRSCWWLSTR